MRIFSTSLAAVAAIGLSLTAASAADMALPAPLPSAPQFSWTGCYVGIQGGGGAMDDTFSGEHGAGAVAGGQAGCNYQTGILVFGIEGDGLWSGLTDTFTNSTSPDFTQLSAHNRWDFDVAGRLGVAFNNVLIYGKAGWVWGRFDFNDTALFSGALVATVTANATLDGLLIGVGAEYAFGPHLSAKFEYNYWNFAAQSVNSFVNSAGLAPFTNTNSQSAEAHVVKVGFNVRFP